MHSPGRFKVTERNSEIRKVVRGAKDLPRSVYPDAHILHCRKLNFSFRYINFVGTFHFRRGFDYTCHSSRDLEAVRFWTIPPSYYAQRVEHKKKKLRTNLNIKTFLLTERFVEYADLCLISEHRCQFLLNRINLIWKLSLSLALLKLVKMSVMQGDRKSGHNRQLEIQRAWRCWEEI